MKKAIFILSLGFIMASCGGSTQTEDVATGTLVDSSLIDTVKQDTTTVEDTAVQVSTETN